MIFGLCIDRTRVRHEEPVQERQISRSAATVQRVPDEEAPTTDSLDFLVRKMHNVLQGREIGQDGPPEMNLHFSTLLPVSCFTRSLARIS